MKRWLKNRKGQSAIEFMICVIVLFFFLFFFLGLSILLVTSSYMDYAVFMAARTYKSAYDNSDTKLQKAQEVFEQYAGKVRGIANNIELVRVSVDPNDANDPNKQGFAARYQMNLFYMPPLFINDPVPSAINLRSEAFLGSDPGLEDCNAFFRNYASQLGLNLTPVQLGELEDNGC